MQAYALNQGYANWNSMGSFNPSGSGTPPVNGTPPSISGSTVVGSTLTATPGTWSGSPAPTVSGVWKSSGTTVQVGGLTYVTQLSDQGDAMTYVETASNGIGAPVQATSNTITMAAYQSQTVALINAMVPPPSATRANYIDGDVIAPLVAAGTWAKIDCLYFPPCESGTQQGTLNWINPTGPYTLVPSGAAPPVFNATGVTGNGSTGYCDSGFNPATAGGQMTALTQAMGVYVNTFSAGNFCDVGNGSSLVFPASTTNNVRIRAGTATNINIPVTLAAAGFVGYVRTSASCSSLVDIAGNILSWSQTAPVLASADIYLCGQNTAGTLTSPSAHQIACAWWGGGATSAFTVTDVQNIRTAAVAYLGHIGAA